MNGAITSAIFASHTDADKAISALRAAGVPNSALSVIGHNEVANSEYIVGQDDTTHSDHIGEVSGHSDSLVTGGTTDDPVESVPVARGIIGGGLLGALLGVAVLAIPGVGPLAAAGAIAAAAVPGAMGAGALIGAGAGGLREALTHHGVHDEDAAFYETNLDSNSVIVTIDNATSGIDPVTAAGILRDAGGRNASTNATVDSHAV